MAQKRPATPTSGPGGDANSVPVCSPGYAQGACQVSNLKQQNVRTYLNWKIFNFSQYILKSRRGNAIFDAPGRHEGVWYAILR